MSKGEVLVSLSESTRKCKPTAWSQQHLSSGYQTRQASGDAHADEGSNTCRCNARHEGWHTSDSICATTRSKHAEKGMVTTGMAQFYLHGTTVGNQGGEGMACSPNALAAVAVSGEEVEQRHGSTRSSGLAHLFPTA